MELGTRVWPCSVLLVSEKFQKIGSADKNIDNSANLYDIFKKKSEWSLMLVLNIMRNKTAKIYALMGSSETNKVRFKLTPLHAV